MRRARVGRTEIPYVRLFEAAIAMALLTIGVPEAGATNAHFLQGVGAIDDSMGGSTVAAPQDTLGALYHNVGSMTQIEGTRVDVGLETILDPTYIESELGGARGKTDSRNDIGLIPAFGVAHTPKGSRMTFFLGALGVSGFGNDYPEDESNPILRPQIENGRNTGGFGRFYSFYQLLRIAGGLAMKVTPDLSIGFSPAIEYATLSLKPAPATTPDCTATGVCAYPSAETTGAFGIGFLLGFHYRWNEQFSLGLGYTSPQWFQDFDYASDVANTELPTAGRGREFKIHANAPQAVDAGLAWTPTPELLVTVAGKWMNLADTAGFGDPAGFDARGRVTGFGWSDTWSGSIGAQYHVTPAIALRLGYNYASNAIDDRKSFFSSPAPACVMHNVSIGGGYDLTDVIQMNLAYWHGFQSSVEGPFISPMGEIPGSKVKSTLSEDSFLLEVSLRL